MKARKRTPDTAPDTAPVIETRHEPSAGILPGRTHHDAGNEAGARQLIETFNTQAQRLANDHWLDAIAARIEAPDSIDTTAPAHTQKRQRYVQEASAHLQGIRRALASNNASAAAWHGYQLGRALERARVAVFEPPAAKGQESMLWWRGLWLSVSDTERGMLDAIGDGAAAALATVYLKAWHTPYHKAHRSKVDKAKTLLNRKLPASLQLHIKRDQITVG